jgi:hypothetical protein
MTLSYSIMLLVHLISLPNENNNHILRYLGFTLAWISKQADGWNTAFWEFLVIVAFICLAIMRYILPQLQQSRPKIQMKQAQTGLAGAAAGLCLFLVLEAYRFDDKTRLNRVLHAFVAGAVNLCSGFAIYYLWQTVPIRKFKEEDGIPTYSDYM